MSWQTIRPIVIEFIEEQKLPAEFLYLVERWYWPLIKRIASSSNSISVLGINGAQGSGKSTLAELISILLQHHAHLRCAVLSIDDFYLPLSDRQQLANTVHPLLAVRGVPGTHDIDLALKTLSKIGEASAGDKLRLPRFNKAADDRLPESEFPIIAGPVDLIILEGWCVGASAQTEAALVTPINPLEEIKDNDGRWRHYVNQQLGGNYQSLFSMIDCLIMLKSPSFTCIEEWRWMQESKLIQKKQGHGTGLMNRKQIGEFVQYYERLTKHCLDEMPNRANLVYHLNNDHQITRATDSLAMEWETSN